ncbi:hypothetical protein KIW84_062184 [Lathyrus oleraceus]|uniref:CCHC-type domain-containing protein n=1 Tax=Pisum sativum TaxID=3888 RepID=A0A9D4W6L5_PEA|nr:hypothetical protein KIW84_062184 [Pisum sativum]
MAGRGRDDAAIAEALGMLAGVLGGNPNVVGMGAARQLSEFQKNNPPMFKGAYDPDGAQKWLKEIERIFRVTECADNQKDFEQDSKARAESYQQRVDRKGKNQVDRGKPYAAGKGFQRQSGMKRPSGGDSSAPAKCYRCGQAGHRVHECTSAEKKCFKCGKGGHLAAECRLKTVTCFNCGEVGHISPQCPKPKRENQSGGKVFALSGSETSADDRLIRGTLW